MPLAALAVTIKVTRLEHATSATAWAAFQVGSADWAAAGFQRQEAYTFTCSYGKMVRGIFSNFLVHACATPSNLLSPRRQQLSVVGASCLLTRCASPLQSRASGDQPISATLAKYTEAFVLRCGALWLVRQQLTRLCGGGGTTSAHLLMNAVSST